MTKSDPPNWKYPNSSPIDHRRPFDSTHPSFSPLTEISDLLVYKGLYESVTLSAKRMVDEGGRHVEQLAIVGTPTGLLFVVGAYALMIIASVYFMWSV